MESCSAVSRLGMVALAALFSGCGVGVLSGQLACEGGPECRAEVACREDFQCPIDQRCVAGLCEEYTFTSTVVRCAGDAECGEGRVCESQACVAGCGVAGSAIMCSAGSLCAASGRCEAVPEMCTLDMQCGAPVMICELSTCALGCGQAGGLACTGGYLCEETTGRCVPPQMMTCADDLSCGAPASICEGGACVPGCNAAGCGGGQVCDTGTGRCVMIVGPCSDDVACGAPAKVCEMGQCIPGCTELGGIQCVGAEMCVPTTGRCS